MKKILIIGAGPAGLTAGLELLRSEQPYEVLILEQSQAIGGISRTVRYQGNRMDIGGHRFFSKDAHVMRWWDALLPLDADPEQTDRAMLLRKRVSRIYYQRKFFDYPVKMNGNTLRNFGFGTTIAAGTSYMRAMVHKLPETSLENFYINRFGRKLYTMFFEGYTEKLWGRHPREISADWGAQRVKGLSILALLRDIFSKLLPGSRREVETSLIEEFRYPKFGPGQLWEAAAAEIEQLGGHISTGCRVTGIGTEGGKVVSVTYQHGDETMTVQADSVISSMPLCDLVAGMENVPADVQRIAKGLPYRDFVTVGLLVDALALRSGKKDEALVPDCWIYVQDTQVKLGRIQIFNNWSPYMVADPEHTVWVGLEYFCKEGDAFWTLPDDELQTLSVKELTAIGVLHEGQTVRDSHVERVQKAYPAYFDTYSEIGRLQAWLNEIDGLYCIGRNGQHRYNNMDHSMVTAFEAVRAIQTGAKDKTAIWNVNTEQQYHEEK